MEKDVQDAPALDERRMSYCEINASDPGNPRLGAGNPLEILRLPNSGTSIRFFMLEPLDPCTWRARWRKGDLDEETGKVTLDPWDHPSQAEGAWAGFFIPLIALMSRIAQRIQQNKLYVQASDETPVWIRVPLRGLTLEPLAGPPTPGSLLEDSSEPGWSPIYICLLGDPDALARLSEELGHEDVKAGSSKQPYA